MRYLRMLSNSAFAGLLAAVYLTWLLLHLNPSVPLTTASVTSLLTVAILSYGIHIFVVSYGLYVVRQVALTEPSTPGWISLRLLTWSAAALSGVATVITGLHASGLRNALDSAAVAGLTRAAGLFAGATVLFLLLGIAQLAARRRGRAMVAVLFTLATISSIVAPMMVRDGAVERASPPARRSATLLDPPYPPESAPRSSGPRIVLIGLDGASLDVISPAVAAGRLPNFGRLLDRGASMHLATTRPTQPAPAWASTLTGKWPAQHGIRGSAVFRPFNSDIALDVLPDYLFSQALVRFGLVIEEPHTSRSLRARPIWDVLESQGMAAGIIGLPLTHPPAVSRGFTVSDHFHRRTDRDLDLTGAAAVEPPEVEPVALAALGDEGEPEFVRSKLGLIPPDAESASLVDADRIHHRLKTRLETIGDLRLIAVRYPGLDAVGHYYLRYAQPEQFGDVSEEERRAYGRVLDDYYGFVDTLVGETLATLTGDDIVVVVSAFGMEPLTLGKRLLERVVGDVRFSGTHERAPDGFLLASGAPIAAGRLNRGAVVDVVPTLLYFLGLPIGRDMDGSARTEMFSRAFNSARTITFIPTYETR